MDRLRVLRTIAANFPALSLNESLLLADALHDEFAKPRPQKYDFSTNSGRVAFARSLPSVMDNLPYKKIQAIKNLRDAMRANSDAAEYAGLKECKDAIDTISPSTYF